MLCSNLPQPAPTHRNLGVHNLKVKIMLLPLVQKLCYQRENCFLSCLVYSTVHILELQPFCILGHLLWVSQVCATGPNPADPIVVSSKRCAWLKWFRDQSLSSSCSSSSCKYKQIDVRKMSLMFPLMEEQHPASADLLLHSLSSSPGIFELSCFIISPYVVSWFSFSFRISLSFVLPVNFRSTLLLSPFEVIIPYLTLYAEPSP